jgi:capsule polysaccharide export protein KpsE/RkpR
MSDTGGNFTVSELVAYCHTQARLLQGHVETLDEETAALLSEIDDELATARAQLDEHEGTDHSAAPQRPDATGKTDDLADLEALEADLAEQQAVVKAKQTRRTAFVELAAAYLELADTLQTDSPGVEAALQRVVQFEQTKDAPTYFDERVTLLEAATADE